MIKIFIDYIISEIKIILLAPTSEKGAFRWIVVLWLVLIIYNENNIHLFVGIIIFAKYSRNFISFIKQVLSNEWPYNALGLVGAAISYFVLTLMPIISNYAISAVTGFHSTFFPNSHIILTSMFIAFAFLFIITAFSLTLAITHFTKGELIGRVVLIIFLFDLCIWQSAIKFIPDLVKSKNKTLLNIESIIINSDFIPNSRITTGIYWDKNRFSRVFGTKICQNYSFDAMIAPHAQGGHIVAERRKIPAELQNMELITDKGVEATEYVYNYINQDECKDMQKYYEYPALMTPKN